MKTKELIELLQKYDPSGEIEIVVDGAPIYFCEKGEAYWDGPLSLLIQDKNNKYFNIEGYKYTDQGIKLNLRTMDLESVLSELMDKRFDKDIIIELDLKSDVSKRITIENINKTYEYLKKELYEGEEVNKIVIKDINNEMGKDN